MRKNFIIQYSTNIEAPAEHVWEALTQADLIKQYFFGTQLETTWVPGQPIFFKGEWDSKPYIDKGIVLEYELFSHLSYSYLSSMSSLEDQPENYLWIEYRLNTIDNKTHLTISQSNYDEEKAEHSKANWEFIINEMKKLILK